MKVNQVIRELGKTERKEERAALIEEMEKTRSQGTGLIARIKRLLGR